MSDPRPRIRNKANLPLWAVAIAKRRRELGYRQSDVEEYSDYIVKQGSVSDMENGRYSPVSMTTERLVAYLKALHWSPWEFTKETGLEMPNVENVTPMMSLSDAAEFGLVSVRVLGDSNKEDAVILFKHMVRDRDPERCFVVYAAGGVFACESVKARYGDGAMFVFAGNEKPVEGKAVAYRMNDTGCLLLCMYKATPPVFAATDYDDPTRAVMVYPNDERLEYLGVLLSAQVEG